MPKVVGKSGRQNQACNDLGRLYKILHNLLIKVFITYYFKKSDEILKLMDTVMKQATSRLAVHHAWQFAIQDIANDLVSDDWRGEHCCRQFCAPGA